MKPEKYFTRIDLNAKFIRCCLFIICKIDVHKNVFPHQMHIGAVGREIRALPTVRELLREGTTRAERLANVSARSLHSSSGFSRRGRRRKKRRERIEGEEEGARIKRLEQKHYSVLHPSGSPDTHSSLMWIYLLQSR